MERYRRRGGVSEKADRGSFKETLKRQAIACCVIFGVIFLTGLLKTETAVKFSERVGSTLSYTVDYEGAAREIVEKIGSFVKEVKNATENADNTR